MNELTQLQAQGGIVSMAIDSLVNQVLKNADDGIEPTDEQIESVISFHNVCGNGQRSAAYWFRQKRVHLKRGFESFEAFGKSVLGHESSHLHRLAKAFEIEKSLNSPMGESIPERQLRPLSKIEPADRQDVWNDAIEKAHEEGKKLGAKHVEEAVNEWREKHEQAQKRINWLEIDKKAIYEQNDSLRNEIAYKVDAKAEAKAAEMKAHELG